jgi:hypothetical protein
MNSIISIAGNKNEGEKLFNDFCINVNQRNKTDLKNSGEFGLKVSSNLPSSYKKKD